MLNYKVDSGQIYDRLDSDMKTNITTTPAAFAPVSITITFETQRELDAFGSAMNTNPITESIEQLGGMGRYTILEQIAEPLQKLGANINQVGEILKVVNRRK